MTWSSVTKFFVENYPDIAAVIELNQRAQKQTPLEVHKYLRAVIAKSIESWKGFDDPIVEVGDETLWWSDRSLYNEEKESGVFFAFWYKDITNRESDCCYMYVGFDAKKGRRAHGPSSVQLEQALRRPTLQDLKFKIGTLDNDRAVKAYRDISHIAGIDKLRDPDQLAREFADAAKDVSERIVAEWNVGGGRAAA